MKRKKRRPNWPLRFILFSFITLATAYVVVIPLFSYLLSPPDQNFLAAEATKLKLFEHMRFRFAEVFLATWFYFVGSAIGSFANVVVYRMPRGMNVASKDSACPWCRTRIKLRHNIPVFGWLMLRGRCYTCRLPISPRYPLVELCFGLMFLILYFVEVPTGAATIPGATIYPNTGVVNILMDPHWDVIGRYFFHCFLGSTLLTWALVVYDNMKIPQLTIGIAYLIGIVLPFVFPFLLPLKWNHVGQPSQPTMELVSTFDFPALAASGITAVCGLLTGLGAGLLCPKLTKNHTELGGLAVCCGLIGLMLGWQGFLAALVVFCFVFLIGKFTAYRNFQRPGIPLFALWLASVLAICCWKPLAHVGLIFGSRQSFLPLVVLAIALLLLWATRFAKSDLLDQQTANGQI